MSGEGGQGPHGMAGAPPRGSLAWAALTEFTGLEKSDLQKKGTLLVMYNLDEGASCCLHLATDSCHDSCHDSSGIQDTDAELLEDGGYTVGALFEGASHESLTEVKLKPAVVRCLLRIFGEEKGMAISSTKHARHPTILVLGRLQA